jgi:hypothetical protein
MRPIRANAMGRITALDLQRRGVGEIRTVALTRMDHQHVGFASCGEQRAAGSNRALQPRDVVTQSGTEPPRLEKVPLHVDDDDRGTVEIDRNGARLCVNRCH